jgi:sugar lactone lactonase YvrE
MHGLVLPIVAGFALCSAALAQTAHYSAGFTVVPTSVLSGPFGVAVDGSGNVYIADTGNKRVLKETWLGNGNYTESVVTTSALVSPKAVAVDANGAVYVADTATTAEPTSSRVLKESPSVSGGVTTYAESIVASNAVNGLLYPSSLAVDKNLAVYIVSFGTNWALKMTPNGSGGYTSSNISQSPGQLWGIAVDANLNVYLSDYSAGIAYEVPWTGSAYGTGSAIQDSLSHPTALAVDASGNVYIADSGNNRIWKDTPTATAGTFTGSALLSELNNPYGVASDASGNLVIADTDSNLVMRETQAGVNFGQVAVPSAVPVPVQASLTFTFDSGGTISAPVVSTQGDPKMDFTDSSLGSCNTNGTTHAYSAGDTCTVIPQFVPSYSGTRYGAVVLLNSSGATIATAYMQGTGLAPQITFSPGTQTMLSNTFPHPLGVMVDSASNVFVVDPLLGNVHELLSRGGYTTVNTLPYVNYPSGGALDGAGNAFIATAQDGVAEIQTSSTPNAVLDLQNGTTSNDPAAVAVDGNGNLFVTDYIGNTVREIPAADGYQTISTVASGFSYPAGVAVDGSGNIFVVEALSHSLKEIAAVNGVIPATSPTIVTLMTGFDSSDPGVAVDGNGNVYVAAGDNTIYELLAADGFKTTKTLSNSTSSTLVTNNDYSIAVAVDGRSNVIVGLLNQSALIGTYSEVSELDFADAPTLNFPDTIENTSSSEQTVTVTNSGNAPLIFSGISGAYSFTPDTSAESTCQTGASNAIAPSESCTLSFAFTPIQYEDVSSQLILTDNALNATAATQSITLKGTGQWAQTITFNPTPPATVVGTNLLNLFPSGGGSNNPVILTVVSGPGSIDGNTLNFSDPGTVVVAANQAGNNYGYAAAPTVTVSITFSQYQQTIVFTAPASPVTYGTAPVTLSASTINLPATTNDLPVTFSVQSGPGSTTGSTLSFTGAGKVVVAANQAGNSYYQAAAQITQSVVVNPAMLTVTVFSPTIFYGAPLPTYSAIVTGYVNSDTSTVVNGAPTFTTAPLAPSAVGSYPITIGNGTLAAANYSFSLVNGKLYIIKSPASFVPSTTTVPSGEAGSIPLTFSGQYSGAGIAPPSGTANYQITNPSSALVASGSLKLMAGTITIPVPNTLASGSYTVSVNYLGDSNYDAVSAPVFLKVSPPLPQQTITFTPPSAPVTYGNSPITLKASASSRLAVTFSLVSGPATLSGSTLTITGAGTVKVAANQAGNGSYAAAPQVTENIVVSPAVLTVTAPSPSIVYGAKLPALTASITGFVNRDTATVVKGTASLSLSGSEPLQAGKFTITAAPGSLAAANYTFKFVDGELTVTPAPLIVEATSISVPYDQPIPKLAYTVKGFVNGDASSILKGAPVERTTAIKGSNYGNYSITITQGTLMVGNNYGLEFVKGTLTITPLGATAKPSFRPGTETSTTALSVTISDATSGAAIYYTINGTTPTTGSLKYSEPIKVSATETVQTIAAAPGYTPSIVSSAAYIIATAPIVMTKTASGVSTSGATLNGTVTADNASTQYWFAYGTSETLLTNTTNKVPGLTGTTVTPVSAKLTGLNTKTKYFFKVVASNAVATAPGTVLSFTTN